MNGMDMPFTSPYLYISKYCGLERENILIVIITRMMDRWAYMGSGKDAQEAGGDVYGCEDAEDGYGDAVACVVGGLVVRSAFYCGRGQILLRSEWRSVPSPHISSQSPHQRKGRATRRTWSK